MIVKKVELKFKRHALPNHIPNPWICCLFCDPDLQVYCFPSFGNRTTQSQQPSLASRIDTQVSAPNPTDRMRLDTSTNQVTYLRGTRPPLQPMMVEQHTGEGVQCNCGMDAVLRTSKQANSNGRMFYCCSKTQEDPTRCKFFQVF